MPLTAQPDPIPILSPEDLARVRAPLARSSTLPPAAYTDARVFDVEVDTVFGRDWVCVARQEQLSDAGDYVCVDLPGQPIVVARGRDGGLRAFSRICLHRAMPVAEGAGNATRFVCPYHHWTYELDGSLRSAPMMEGAEGFEASRCRLPALRLEVWQGFVFVNRDPDAAALAPRLAGLEALIRPYGFGELVVAATTEFDSPWNWKILVENFMEAYHHIGTHSTTFEPVYPARSSSVPDNGGAPWTFLRMPGKPSPDGGEVALFPALHGDERHQLVAANVYPTLLFAASAAGAFWYQLEPRAHDAMNLKIHVLLPGPVADAMDDDARAGAVELVRGIHFEDIPANEGPWLGLHGKMTGQGRLSPYEKAIWQLNQLWLDRVESRLLGRR